MAHTPGPWSVLQGSDENDFIVAERSGNTVCEPNAELFNDWPNLDPSVRHIGLDEAKANARLIAAAPDLLDALKAVVAVLQKEAPGTALNHHRYDAVGSQAHAAIAKAEGR